MRVKLLGSLLAGVLLATAVTGCGAGSGTDRSDPDQTTVTDLLGRQVELALPAQRVVAIGPGALRLYTYVNGPSGIVGVEQVELDQQVGKPYRLAYPELVEQPVIGPGGPNNAPDPERLLTVGPDVIFSMYTTDQAAVDGLQRKIGIPVLALSYGQRSTFDPDVYQSLRLIGEVTGERAAAEDVITYMERCQEDLAERTTDIPAAERPSVYIGALGARGTHGIESTQGDYSLFDAVGAHNVVDETDWSGSVMIDKEMLIQWDPDKIFLDLAGFPLVQQDYQQHPAFYQALSAVTTGELYGQLPYNYYHTNLGTAMADAYFIGTVLYPKQFTDIDPAAKADEIYQVLLGQPVYRQLADEFGEFGPLTLR